MSPSNITGGQTSMLKNPRLPKNQSPPKTLAEAEYGLQMLVQYRKTKKQTKPNSGPSYHPNVKTQPGSKGRKNPKEDQLTRVDAQTSTDPSSRPKDLSRLSSVPSSISIGPINDTNRLISANEGTDADLMVTDQTMCLQAGTHKTTQSLTITIFCEESSAEFGIPLNPNPLLP